MEAAKKASCTRSANWKTQRPPSRGRLITAFLIFVVSPLCLHNILNLSKRTSELRRNDGHRSDKRPQQETSNNLTFTYNYTTYLSNTSMDADLDKELRGCKGNSLCKYLSDPRHTPRLRKFTDMEAFPKPSFHGCRSSGLCTFSNVCFSTQEGMLVMEVPGLDPTNTSMWHEASRNVPKPRRIRRIRYSKYKGLKNVYFTKSMYVLNCWRQTALKDNPAHLLMGYGKIFVASTGFHNAREGEPLDTFDMVVYHLCELPWWPWAQFVDSLINSHAIKNGIINNVAPSTINEARIFLPLAREQLTDPRPNDIVICGETVFQEPFSLATYFGENDPKVVAEWRDWTRVQKVIPNTIKAMQETVVEDILCPRQLRFALWNRTEGTSLRLLTNVNDIRRVVSDISDHPLSILTASSKTSPEEQVSLFRSFDVLITPHGSHLANMIFAKPRTAFIEVSAVFFDEAPSTNGAAFAAKWILSLGHPTTNAQLTAKMKYCMHRDQSEKGTCPRGLRTQFIHSNLIVNTTILRRDIESVVATLCEK